jgi:hypothetical protein
VFRKRLWDRGIVYFGDNRHQMVIPTAEGAARTDFRFSLGRVPSEEETKQFSSLVQDAWTYRVPDVRSSPVWVNANRVEWKILDPSRTRILLERKLEGVEARYYDANGKPMAKEKEPIWFHNHGVLGQEHTTTHDYVTVDLVEFATNQTKSTRTTVLPSPTRRVPYFYPAPRFIQRVNDDTYVARMDPNDVFFVAERFTPDRRRQKKWQSYPFGPQLDISDPQKGTDKWIMYITCETPVNGIAIDPTCVSYVAVCERSTTTPFLHIHDLWLSEQYLAKWNQPGISLYYRMRAYNKIHLYIFLAEAIWLHYGTPTSTIYALFRDVAGKVKTKAGPGDEKEKDKRVPKRTEATYNSFLAKVGALEFETANGHLKVKPNGADSKELSLECDEDDKEVWLNGKTNVTESCAWFQPEGEGVSWYTFNVETATKLVSRIFVL